MKIEDVKKIMTDAWISNPEVREKYELQEGDSFENSFSVVSIENILFYAVASAVWLSYQLFDSHKSETEQILKEQMSGTAGWYVWKARQFQYGMPLIPEKDYYDNSGLTDDQIEEKRVVKYAAAVESKDKSILYIKVASGDNSERKKLNASQLIAFEEYINAVSYAGVRTVVINQDGDEIQLKIDIYYDPLVLDETGSRLDGTANTPIQDTIRNYLANLTFNGTYTGQGLVDTLQVIAGVRIAEIKSAASRYGAYSEFREINAREIPQSGYYRLLPENLQLNFISDEQGI
jgi:hypothetical protein